MGKDIDTMTSQEIIEYLKQTHHHSVGQYASSIDLANIFFERLCHNKWLIFDEK